MGSFIHSTAFAMRNVINNSTKCTPSEMVLGDNVIQPIDFCIKGEKPTNYANKQAREFASSLANRIQISGKAVNKNLENSRKKMKSSYDKKNSRHEENVGDYVMLWWPYFRKGIPRSFQPKWKGPYMIKSLIGNTNCQILMNGGQVKNVHLNQLKPVLRRDIPVDLNNRKFNIQKS